MFYNYEPENKINMVNKIYIYFADITALDSVYL